MTILIDTAEPESIVKLLSQSVPTAVLNLNQTSRSDYYFGGEDGKTRQYGRVQAGELLGNIDSMEDELRRYYMSADINNQIIEGIISPVPITKKNKTLEAVSIRLAAHPSVLFSYKVTESGYIYDEQVWNISHQMLHSWLCGLDESGVRTYNTVNYVDTANFLVSAYKYCQKPNEEHKTLNRIYRPRISIKSQDPMVKALMSLSLVYDLGIGEEKAKSLATAYHSIMDIMLADEKELKQIEGIGKVIANKLLKALGREV